MTTAEMIDATMRPGFGEIGNTLLNSLSPEDFSLLAPDLERVPFIIGDMLARAGEPVDNVCFPEGAIAGVLDSLDGDNQFAVGLVGHEGFIGWSILMGDNLWPYDVVMRAECGSALRLSVPALLRAAARSETLRTALLRFANVFMIQMGRTIVSSLAHTIERRMARWILLYHDRVQTNEISMTHEEFGLMLGVRRSSVTDALHALEGERAIKSVRGKVIVIDRAKLIELAGGTYGHAESEYCRLIAGARDPA